MRLKSTRQGPAGVDLQVDGLISQYELGGSPGMLAPIFSRVFRLAVVLAEGKVEVPLLQTPTQPPPGAPGELFPTLETALADYLFACPDELELELPASPHVTVSFMVISPRISKCLDFEAFEAALWEPVLHEQHWLAPCSRTWVSGMVVVETPLLREAP